MENSKEPINLIGLALKGGNAAIGRDSVRAAIHSGNFVYLFLARDAGNAIKDEMQALSRVQRVAMTELGSRKSLGRALGRNEVAIVAITDRGLANAINEALRRQV